MSKLEQIKALAAQAAATGPDMNEAQKGGGGARLLPEGYAFGRFVEYIELGKHAQEFQGKAKEPALEVQIAFALWGQGYQNDDGTPYILRPFQFAVSRNEKAKAFKLFKALNWQGTAKHFAELLGQAFLVKIVHEAKSKTDATLVSRIDFAGFLPPLDPVTKAPYPIPEAADDLYQLFLWDYPTKEGWDALYVEGKWDDGKSKNRVQETIMSALDFAGSPLQQLLMGSGAIAALPVADAVAPPAAALPPGAGYAPAFAQSPATVPTVAPVAPPVQAVAPVAAPLVQSAVAAVAPLAPVTSSPVVPPVATIPVGLPTSPSNPA